MSGLERLLIGRTLDGRYAIEELIGQGRGGSVYRARHTRLGSLLAVKVLASPRNPEARERFRRLFRHEAALAAGVRHPGLPLVIGSGTDAELDVDFFVTELLEGEKLSCVLAQRGKPPAALALRLLSEAAAGAGAAHGAGLVHRDLRPANLYLVRSPAERHVRARVVGFGVPQLASRATLASADAALVGYAPPELFAGGRLTPAGDVFSLGAIGYELLAGRVPFDEAGRRALAEGRPVPLAPPAEPGAAVPAHVIEAILCALRPNPDERFADAAAFQIALDTVPAASSLPVPAIGVPGGAADAEPAAPDSGEKREEAAPAEVKELLARIDSEVVAAEADGALEPPVAEIPPPSAAEVGAALAEFDAEVETAPVTAAEPVTEAEPAGAAAGPALAAEADSAGVEAESPTVAEAEPADITVTVTVTEAEPAVAGVESIVSEAGTGIIEAESTVVEPAPKPFTPPPPPADLLRAASLAPPRRGGQRDGAPSHPPTAKPKPGGGRAGKAAAAPVEPVGAFATEREIAPPDALVPQPPIEVLAAQVTSGAPRDVRPEPASPAPAAPVAALPSPARRRRVLVAPSERSAKRPPVLVGLVVAVLLVGAAGGLAMFRRGASDARAASPEAVNQLAAGTAAAPVAGQPADARVQASIQAIAEQPEEPQEEAAKQKTPEELAAEARRAQQEAALQQQAQQAAATAQATPAQQPPAPQPAPAAPAPVQPQPQLAAAPPPPAPEPTIAPAESRRAAPAIYDADAVEQQPALVNGPEVGRLLRERYPMQMLRNRIEGRVTATFVVREDGSVDPSSVRVVSSANAAFNNATAGVLRRARFSPARVNGQPVKSQVTMPVVWAIDR